MCHFLIYYRYLGRIIDLSNANTAVDHYHRFKVRMLDQYNAIDVPYSYLNRYTDLSILV